MSELEIRPYRAGDEHGWVDCFNRIFPTADGVIRGIDLDEWRWKFAANPLGRIEMVVAEDDREGIVGSYACQPLRVWFDGRERRSSQIVDLMVRSEFRRKGGRPGLFVHLGRAFYDLYCGDADDRQVFNYGWPVPAWRVGQRYLRYENIRDWNLLYREFRTPGEHQAAPTDLDVVRVDAFGAEVDDLFERIKPSFALSLIKDSAYLNWRFRDRPHKRYRRYECRETATGRLRAAFVYALADFKRPDTAYIVDWVVPADDADAIRAIVCAAERLAHADGSPVVAGVWSPTDPRFEQLQRLGFWLRDTGYFLVVASFRPDTVTLRDSWNFTMGDSDLV